MAATNDEVKAKSGEKRRRTTLSIADKLEIVDKLEKGVNRKVLLSEYNIGSSTLYDIKHSKQKLLQFSSETDKSISERKNLRRPKLEELDKVLYEWFCFERSEGSDISGPMIIAKAKELKTQMNVAEECAFSDGWLNAFKLRHGIRKLNISAEDARKRWKNLYDLYRKENKIDGQQTEEPCVSRWKWFKSMEKLISQQDVKEITGDNNNVIHDISQLSNAILLDDAEHENSNSGFHQDSQDSEDPSVSTDSFESPRRCERNEYADSSNRNNADLQMVSLTRNFHTSLSEPPHADEIYYYCMSLAHRLRQLDQQQQAEVRFRFEQALYEISLQ